MKKIKIYAPVDYLMGHLRYGHFEGEVELTEDDFEKFKEDPMEALFGRELFLRDWLELVVDDWEVDDYGDITSVDWEEVEEGDK